MDSFNDANKNIIPNADDKTGNDIFNELKNLTKKMCDNLSQMFEKKVPSEDISTVIASTWPEFINKYIKAHKDIDSAKKLGVQLIKSKGQMRMIGGPRVPTTVIPHNDGSNYAPTNDDKRQLKNLKLIYKSILAIEDKLTTPNINLDELSKSVGSFVPTITSSDLLEKVYPRLAQMFTINFNNLKNASNVSLNKRYKLKILNNYMTN